MKANEFFRRNPPLALAAGGNLLLLGVLVPLAFFDHRLVMGQPVWIKPIKFAFSIGLYSATLFWILQYLPRPVLVRRVSWILGVTSLIEMACIIGQAARGVHSHFNFDTYFDMVIFQIMGISITIFWIAHTVSAVALLREKAPSPGALLSGIKGGLCVAAVGMVIAFAMTVPGLDGPMQMSPSGQPQATGHAVGAPEDAPGLALLGWSLTGGDLRISHFVGLHAVQLIPLFALVIMKLGLADRRARIVTRAFSFSYGLAVIVLFGQALRGIPFHHMDSLTAGGYAICAAVLGTGFLAAARQPLLHPV